MPLTKQYLRYEQSASFGLVCGRSGNLLLQTQRAGGAQRRALVVAPAAEDLIVWDIRKGDRVSVFGGITSRECLYLSLSLPGRRRCCEEGRERRFAVCVGVEMELQWQRAAHRETFDCGTLFLEIPPSYSGVSSHPHQPHHPPCSGHKSAVTCLQFDHSATRLVSGSKVSC